MSGYFFQVSFYYTYRLTVYSFKSSYCQFVEGKYGNIWLVLRANMDIFGHKLWAIFPYLSKHKKLCKLTEKKALYQIKQRVNRQYCLLLIITGHIFLPPALSCGQVTNIGPRLRLGPIFCHLPTTSGW